MENDAIIVEPENKEVAFSVIWMHGLGADASDFLGIDKILKRSSEFGVRYILPNAPYRAVTINGGMQMRAWYDITNMEMLREVDEEGMEQSATRVRDLIAEELDKKLALSNIILAGFSQGGAVALYTAITYDKPLGGVIALSTYYPTLEKLTEQHTKVSQPDAYLLWTWISG